MSIDADALYHLLPAIHRIRDEQQGKPLHQLLTVLAGQLQVMEENIEQLYDDQFIETCAGWVVPYIGDLVGYRPLYGQALGVGTPRAEVAHTIALRRRKGSAAVLEQLARDVTGWNARAVELFQRLATTQHMNHVRAGHHYAPDLRRWEALERIDTAFDSVAHTVDVRRIGKQDGTGGARGRYNIPNIGIFLWPIGAHAATRAPALQVDARRWRISPLNHDAPLYSRPEAEDHISHLAEPANVPQPLSRRVLDADVRGGQPLYYGDGRSLALYLNGTGTPVAPADLRVCNLADDGATWAHLPDDKIAIDPVLGRIALPAAPVPPITSVEVTHHTGFSADIGGGEYERAASFGARPRQTVLHVPGDHADIQSALDALGGDGVVEVGDNARYPETLAVQVKAGGRIELRSANERRACLALTGEFTVHGEGDSEFALNGLLVTGEKLRVPASATNRLARLHIVHATLVPGWALQPGGAAAHPDEASLVVEIADTRVALERAIIGGVRTPAGASVTASDSIIDATAVGRVAFAAPDGKAAGAQLSLDGCTVIGKVHAASTPLISNSLLLAEVVAGDGWSAPVRAGQKQTGCVRFSWLPPASRVPRRFHCLPAENGNPAPRMLSLRYGTPRYCRLAAATAQAIRQGADDEGEIGAFHHLLGSQRETNIRLRLAEYLRAGLEAGVLYEI